MRQRCSYPAPGAPVVLVLAACASASPDMPPPAVAPVVVAQDAPANATNDEPVAPEPALVDPEPEAVGELVTEGVRFLVRGRAQREAGGWSLEMVVTAATSPDREVWLFGLHDGLDLGGRLHHEGAAHGGGFGEGGTKTGVHLRGATPVEMRRTYPRNEGDEALAPGATVEADLFTSVCPDSSMGPECVDVVLPTVVLRVPTEGGPKVEVR